MRCVVARAVRAFLLEPKSRSGGRSAATSILKKIGGNKRCKKHDFGPSMRGRRAGGKRRQPRAVASHRAVATPSPACGAVFRAQRPTLGNGHSGRPCSAGSSWTCHLSARQQPFVENSTHHTVHGVPPKVNFGPALPSAAELRTTSMCLGPCTSPTRW